MNSISYADDMLICEGDTVIIRMYDDKSTTLINVVRGEMQKIGRYKYGVGSLIGMPYGSIYEIVDRKFVRIFENEEDTDDLLDMDEMNGCSDKEVDNNEDMKNKKMKMDNNNSLDVLSVVDKNNAEGVIGHIGGNKNFNDTNTAQKIDHNDIEKLKRSGASGSDIIKALMANSDTFNSKTTFSQAKWIKRKRMKYCLRFRVIKSSPMSLCEVYHNKSTTKIGNLRWDTLAQVLSHGGVYANSKVLVFDSALGLVVGAIAYRMRGFGKISAIYPGQQPHLELVGRLNLSVKSLEIIEPVASSEIYFAALDVQRKGFHSPVPSAPSGLNESKPNSNFDNKIQEVNEETMPSANETSVQGVRTQTYRKLKYQSSGRQPHDLIKSRASLREGYSRYVGYVSNTLVSMCIYLI